MGEEGGMRGWGKRVRRGGGEGGWRMGTEGGYKDRSMRHG